MNFASAIFAMECGRKVRRHHWSGYWKIKNGEVIICCKDGEVLNLRHSGDMIYTLKNMACDDWEIVPDECRIPNVE